MFFPRPNSFWPEQFFLLIEPPSKCFTNIYGHMHVCELSKLYIHLSDTYKCVCVQAQCKGSIFYKEKKVKTYIITITSLWEELSLLFDKALYKYCVLSWLLYQIILLITSMVAIYVNIFAYIFKYYFNRYIKKMVKTLIALIVPITQ